MYTMIFHVKISLAGLLSENSRYKALQTSPPPPAMIILSPPIKEDFKGSERDLEQSVYEGTHL